jgi:ATP-dependent helicase/nuclease subunit B
VQVRLLLGAAGSGKTFQCLSEARQALSASAEGLPLVLVAPKQGTYQLEQQLLATPSLAGYTRLWIVSFESLARFILDRLEQERPRILTAEGRLMVLRGLLTEKRHDLKLFRASARLTGFAQHLSQILSELQNAQLSPADLMQLAARVAEVEGLAFKLQDFATILQEYLDWLEAHDLQDQDALLKTAADRLRTGNQPTLRIESLWVDGFAEFSELELELLCALAPCCDQVTLTFCLDSLPFPKASWISHGSLVERNLDRCRKRFAAIPGVELRTQPLARGNSGNRFSANPILRHLENCWSVPRPYAVSNDGSNRGTAGSATRRAADETVTMGVPELRDSLRLVGCADREAEVTLAAREILSFVRAGARYREASVVLRNLEPYYQIIQRVFSRYQIPFFLDQRESVSHHPLAELTRSAVRLVAFGWQQQDWFAALKSGLVPAQESEIDLIENEALARGWKGQAWHQPIRLRESPKTPAERERLAALETQLDQIRRQIVPPFEQFNLALGSARHRPAGPQLASAIRELWSTLDVQGQLENWGAAEPSEFESRTGLSVHETVWRQMNAWLDNAELAFPTEPLPLREWLPILEAGLANLTVGIIPPALDQVLIGSVARSRTPEVKLVVVLGLNEGIFPAPAEPGCLLTENDRLELEKCDVVLASTTRRQLGREQYLAYIACTRAREKLVLTWASRDPSGVPLNPSSLVSHVRKLFPTLQPEEAPAILDWRESEHVSELVGASLRTQSAECAAGSAQYSEFRTPHSALLSLPGMASLVKSLRHFAAVRQSEPLSSKLAGRLYGPVLRTSVSRMEQFAACPFKFFVHSGLRAEERKLFELDAKEQGTFQHDVLAMFHEELRAEGKRWRDITPGQARERVGKIARGFVSSFREGLLETSEETRFTARILTESLMDFVETLVDWMHRQYQFDPVEVELPFGEEDGSPAWALDLDNEKRLQLYGRIDRVDLYRPHDGGRALCVVVDYKSSQKQLDPILVSHGVQLQLLAYLNVLRNWPDPIATFAAECLEPAGVFYVNLRGKYGRERNRTDALADPDRARKLAYRHSGRFDLGALPHLDSRPGAREGDQFNYRLTNAGKVNKTCKEPVAKADFEALLFQVDNNLKQMGREVYAGRAEVDPYRKGAVTACDQCTYSAVCRIDPWTHRYRVLRRGLESGSPPGR